MTRAPGYRYGEERRQAIRLLRRVVRAWEADVAVEHGLHLGDLRTGAIVVRVRTWLDEHDDLLQGDVEE